MTDGWIKLHRQLMEKAIWKCSNAKQKVIMITLLLMANHENNEWEWQGKKFICKPGQFITSLKSIKAKAGRGISVKNVRTSLVKFQNYEFLANQSAMTGRLITIVNWGQYQSSLQKVAKKKAKRWQRGGKEVATNKNDKNVKNDKNKNYLLLAKLLGELILQRKPDFKIILKQQKKDWVDWTDDIRKIIELDNRDPERINIVINWCQQDDFWQNNILSPKTLRKQFDKLELQINKSQPKDPYQNVEKFKGGKYAIKDGEGKIVKEIEL